MRAPLITQSCSTRGSSRHTITHHTKTPQPMISRIVMLSLRVDLHPHRHLYHRVKPLIIQMQVIFSVSFCQMINLHSILLEMRFGSLMLLISNKVRYVVSAIQISTCRSLFTPVILRNSQNEIHSI